MNLAQKKEQVVISYSQTFDKQMAYTKVGLSKDEIKELDEDFDFQNRLEIFLIEEREKIIQKLKDLKDSDNEQISFKATLELARVLYPDFFEAKEKPKGVDVNVNINNNNTEEENKLIEEEYGRVLGDKDYFKSTT